MQCNKCKKFMKWHKSSICRSCSGITVKVTYADGRVMLFGDSYKEWEEQFREYTGLHCKDNPPVLFEESRTPWIGGGAKWRSLQIFIDELLENGGGSIDDFNFKEFYYHATR